MVDVVSDLRSQSEPAIFTLRPCIPASIRPYFGDIAFTQTPEAWEHVFDSGANDFAMIFPLPFRRNRLPEPRRSDDMMRIVPNLLFHGNCREAFAFYASALEGKLTSLITYGEVPGEEKLGTEYQSQVMHAWLEVDDQAIMGGDIPSNGVRRVSGVSVAIHLSDDQRARRVFDALSAGATITMSFRATPWSPGFGMLIDRFGTPWVVNTRV